MKPMISASIMCADLLALEKEVARLKEAKVDWLHIDVMDGHFVPNMVIGCPDLVKALKAKIELPLDVHLMIKNPENHIQAFAEAGADILVIHYEATQNPRKVLAQIKNLGLKPGIAFNPTTPISDLNGLIDDVGMILLMTVNPGFAGQGFIEDVLPKIKKTRKMIGKKPIDIQVDGGLTPERIAQCAEKGANVFVAGTSSIFQKGGGLKNNFQHIVETIHCLQISQ
jgi:ribulose-phosphate 3-epimerase